MGDFYCFFISVDKNDENERTNERKNEGNEEDAESTKCRDNKHGQRARK